MKRFFVRVGLHKIKRFEKPTRGNGVIKAMTGNPNFPGGETAVMLNELQTATDELQTANANAGANAGSHQLLSIAIEKEVVWNFKYWVVARYVQDKADANVPSSKSIIESAGFDTRKTREAAPIPDAVGAIAAIFTGAVGTILIKWSRSDYTRFYHLFMTTTPLDEDSWKLVTSLTRRKYLATGLQSATRYHFRVTAVGTAGSSNPSGVASQITTL